MDLPTLDYKPVPPDEEPPRGALSVSFPFVLPLVWGMGIILGATVSAFAFNLRRAPRIQDEWWRRELAWRQWEAWVWITLWFGVVLMAILHRRIRRSSVTALLIALGLGLLPSVVSIVWAWLRR
jgi:hypothetical protein